jgi:hypothetical protein
MPGTSLAGWANLTGVAGLHLAGHQGPRPFPDEAGALKCLYLVTRPLDPIACQEHLAIYLETGDQYREGIAFR